MAEMLAPTVQRPGPGFEEAGGFEPDPAGRDCERVLVHTDRPGGGQDVSCKNTRDLP